jgi:hypothetical protein
VSYNISSRIYIRSLERAMRAAMPVKVLPRKPASQTDSRAVAAAAELSDSKLTGADATSAPVTLKAKLGLRYER